MVARSAALKTATVEEGRNARRRRTTRARLLKAAYEVMSTVGVDAAKLKDITDHADIGFGTIYNYFQSRDELAAQVLDCVISDLGRRNVVATGPLRERDFALVMPVSTRLVLREAMSAPMWQWWALRPDLLATRMCKGFSPFATADMREAMARGIIHLDGDTVETAWTLAVWTMVGGIHDVVVGDAPRESEAFVAEFIMRSWGVSPDIARLICHTELPKSPPPPRIDWAFELKSSPPPAEPGATAS